MLTAARTVIARNWRKTAAPSIGEWVCEMSEMQSVEMMIGTEGGPNSGHMAKMGGV